MGKFFPSPLAFTLLFFLLFLTSGSNADYSQENEFLQWLESLGEQGAAVNPMRPAGGNFDPQSLSRLLRRRSDPSLHPLDGVEDDEDERELHKRGGMVRLVRSDAENAGPRSRRGGGRMVRLLRSGMVRLMKKKRGGLVRLL